MDNISCQCNITAHREIEREVGLLGAVGHATQVSETTLQQLLRQHTILAERERGGAGKHVDAH